MKIFNFNFIFNCLIPIIIKLLLICFIFAGCGKVIYDCNHLQNDEETYNNVIKKDCLVKLNKAGKALNLTDFKKSLDEGIVCLENNKAICVDNEYDNIHIESEADFKAKIEILKSLSKEASSTNELNSEILIQKYNRVVFNYSFRCDKNSCNYKPGLFICNYWKDNY